MSYVDMLSEHTDINYAFTKCIWHKPHDGRPNRSSDTTWLTTASKNTGVTGNILHYIQARKHTPNN